jgi:hypothetical protein
LIQAHKKKGDVLDLAIKVSTALPPGLLQKTGSNLLSRAFSSISVSVTHGMLPKNRRGSTISNVFNVLHIAATYAKAPTQLPARSNM